MKTDITEILLKLILNSCIRKDMKIIQAGTRLECVGRCIRTVMNWDTQIEVVIATSEKFVVVVETVMVKKRGKMLNLLTQGYIVL